jgi:uncharacterized iron-regulated protein
VKRIAPSFTVAVLVVAAIVRERPAAAADVLDLAVGDPARKERHAPLVLDGITDTRTSEVITPASLAKKLEGVSLLFVGENHTSVAFHDVQLRVLQELVRSGRKVLLGLEMYPYTEQRFLDEWGAGRHGEESFLELSRWYKNWGYHWSYYRDIFVFARERKVPIFAVNAPRDVVTAVRKKGFEGLTADEAKHIPRKVDVESAEHRKLFRAFFDDDDDTMHVQMTDAQWDSMFQAQCTWDAVMAHNALQALRTHGGPGAIMVVLIGQGHVAYDLGAARQAAIGFDGKIASVVPVPVLSDKREPVKVRASYASFLWGIPAEEDPIYPSFGISTREGKEKPGLSIIDVQKKSVAEACGLAVGDELATLDGVSVPDKESLNRFMAGKRWGDEVRVNVKRGGEEKSFACPLRRKLEESAKAAAK